MSDILAKLFARGNRASDRFYVDRARPERAQRQLDRERRQQDSAGSNTGDQGPEKKQ
jgi:hypothetical protein